MNQADLTTGDIGAHLRRLAWPAAVGLFFNTLFNITDTFYAGLISTAAVAALTFAFPLFFVMLSCCVGLSQAATALAGSALGAARRARARFFGGQTLLLALAIGLALPAIMIPSLRFLLAALGADGDAFAFAADYCVVLFIGTPFFLLSFAVNGLLNALGNTRAFRDSLIAGALLNIVLDPMLMFGWFGLPALGVGGVALATVIVHFFGLLWLVIALAQTDQRRKWRVVFLIPRAAILLRLIKQAAPPTAGMLSIGGGFFIVTFFLARLDEAAVPAYGIALRVEQLFLLLMVGLNTALLATASQNFGAGLVARARLAHRAALRYGMAIAAGGALMLILGGQALIGLFTADDAVVALGYGYLLAAALLAPFYAVLHTCGAMLQAAKRPAAIAVAGAFRLLIAPPFLFWIFTGALGVAGIWLGLILANIAAAAAVWAHTRAVLRTLPVRASLAAAGYGGATRAPKPAETSPSAANRRHDDGDNANNAGRGGGALQ